MARSRSVPTHQWHMQHSMHVSADVMLLQLAGMDDRHEPHSVTLKRVISMLLLWPVLLPLNLAPDQPFIRCRRSMCRIAIPQLQTHYEDSDLPAHCVCCCLCCGMPGQMHGIRMCNTWRDGQAATAAAVCCNAFQHSSCPGVSKGCCLFPVHADSWKPSANIIFSHGHQKYTHCRHAAEAGGQVRFKADGKWPSRIVQTECLLGSCRCGESSECQREGLQRTWLGRQMERCWRCLT